MSDMTDEAELAKQIEICEFFPAKFSVRVLPKGGWTLKAPPPPAPSVFLHTVPSRPKLRRSCDAILPPEPARARLSFYSWRGDVESPCHGPRGGAISCSC